jgi:hypothetical protein
MGRVFPRDEGLAFALVVLCAVSACSKTNNDAVDAVLTADDPCAVERLTPSEVEWLKENDTRRTPTGAVSRTSDYEAKLGQCKFRRNQELRVRQCADVAHALPTGKPASEVSALGDDERQLVQRVATGQLTADDLKHFNDEKGVPCADTPSGPALRDAMVKAAGRTTGAWFDADPVPDGLIAAVHAKGMDAVAAKELGTSADLKARAALDKGKSASDLEPGAKACQLASGLGAVVGPDCAATQQKYKALAAAQEAAQKREQARCDRLRSAREACTKQCEDRLPKDEVGFADFDKGLDCDERCERAVPMGSCE